MWKSARSVIAASLVAFVAACGGAGGANRDASAATPEAAPEVEEKVVYERLPDGRVKKTTTRTTKRVVPAPPPPARPADPYPSDPLVRYNVERINGYRAQKGLGALLFDAKISAFARAGSERLSHDHAAHAHFAANAQGSGAFGSRSAENQADPSGVPSLDRDAVSNGKKQIDLMLKLMMDEGPGGGHHDNMMNPRFRRVGVGLVYAGDKLYLTNDFSD